MAFTLKQMIDKKDLSPDYVNTAFMFGVDETNIQKLSSGDQFALGQIEYTESIKAIHEGTWLSKTNKEKGTY